MKMILIKDKNAINKLSKEKRNKYLQKLEDRREVVYDKLVKLTPKPSFYYVSITGDYEKHQPKGLNSVQAFKKNSLNNELHDISNAIWHIRYLNRQDKFKQINECQDYEREL